MADNVSTQKELKEAGDAKARLQTAVRIWRAAPRQFTTAAEVANYLNLAPAQGPGEATVSGNTGGPFDVWVYY